MSKFPYKIGDRVRLGEEEGEIAFISSQYITLSTHRWPKEDTLHGYQEVKVLIYPSDWPNLEKLD